MPVLPAVEWAYRLRMSFDPGRIITNFAQAALPPAGVVNSCLLASYGLALRAALNPRPAVPGFFADYCAHFGVPQVPTAEHAFATDHQSRIGRGAPGYNVIHLVHGAGPGTFAAARGVTKTLSRYPFQPNVQHIEAELQTKSCIALLSLSQSPTTAHSVCVVHWANDFHFVDPILASRVASAASSICGAIAAFGAAYQGTFTPDEVLLFEF